MNYPDGNFTFVNETSVHPPRLDWRQLKNHVLFKKYNLSLVMVGKKTAFDLSRRYRKSDKTKSPNVLAFPISQNEGEILLNVGSAKKEAERLNYSFRCYVAFLYIHAMLHLAGYAHDSEKQERKMDKRTRTELKKLGCVLSF